MSTLYVGLQGSYKVFEIAVFADNHCLQVLTKQQEKASSNLLNSFQKVLENNKLALSSLQFIAVDQGPGAFTCLRVIMATVNALSFATSIPLIGIDGLEALSQDAINLLKQKNHNFENSALVSLLNAYNNEVYFAIYDIIVYKNKDVKLRLCVSKGYKKVDKLFCEISQKLSGKKLFFTGNGAALHRNLILEIFQERAVIQSPLLGSATAKCIGEMGFKCWNNKEKLSFQLWPLYLKTQTFAVRK